MFQATNVSSESHQCIHIYHTVDEQISYGVSFAGGEKLSHTANRVLIEVMEEHFDAFQKQLDTIDKQHENVDTSKIAHKVELRNRLTKFARDYSIMERRYIVNELQKVRNETLKFKQASILIAAHDLLNHQNELEELVRRALLVMTELCDKAIITIRGLAQIYAERVYGREVGAGLTLQQHVNKLIQMVHVDENKHHYTWADGLEMSNHFEKAKVEAVASLFDLQIEDEIAKSANDNLDVLFEQLRAIDSRKYT